MEKLRRALLAPEQNRIEHLEQRPAVTADDLADVLPEAVARATGTHEQELAIALEPAVTSAVSGVVMHRPEMFGEILAPTIGAAVRKAVADAFAALLQRFDEALERSLSVRSLKWRVEAARTGVPFAEVVLLRTLKFRVEQVFLIHTPTALVLEHVVDPLLRAESADQVAAMLSAMDAFGREAFGADQTEEHLDKLKLGELTVWICRGPSVTVAAVIRGIATESTAQRLSEARERIALAHQAELARFEGDVTAFAGTRPVLEALVRKELETPPRRAHVWLSVVAAALVFAVGLFAWRAHVRDVADARAMDAAARALASEPGIVTTSLEWHHRRGRVTGFRDPLAAPPAQVLARAGVPAATVAFVPFVSLDPAIVVRRAGRALAPPRGVSLTMQDGTLAAHGIAPRAWARDARLVARTLVGVEQYDDRGLVAAEDVELRAAAAALEDVTISFAPDEAIAGPAQEPALVAAAARAQRLVRAGAAADAGICIEVLGHADRSGHSGQNTRLSDGRAAAAVARLVALGVPRANLRARGAGEWGAEGALARSITFVGRTGAAGTDCGGRP